jgi:CNT family concentrative nucleoside transporter
MANRLTSLFGVIVLLLCAWGLSTLRRRFPWRTVIAGLVLQWTIAVFAVKTSIGITAFHATERLVDSFNDCAFQGARIIFGPLADATILKKAFGESMVFAVGLAASMIVIASVSALLYHWGVLQQVVRGMAWIMRYAMRTSGSETLAATVNIFLGQNESALVIKPYIQGMTISELMALMTIGMATIASGILIVYARMGISAGHLLTASMMSAPAGLLISKIMFPETGKSETAAKATVMVRPDTLNSFDAICHGAREGMALAINVTAMVIAFVAIISLANVLFYKLQASLRITHLISIQDILGWMNAPFAWLIGVPRDHCILVGRLLGERIVLNEFVSYSSLSRHAADLDQRSYILATYALCGFANFSSIAIQIGGIGTLVPLRRNDLAKLGFRAMIAGLLSCYLSAATIGLLI